MESQPQLTRSPLRQQVYELLRERIVTGEIAPGACVRDTDVAKDLGASRTPVREAFVRLTAEGLLLNPMGRGFHVPPLMRREVEETHPLLTLLEPQALKSAPKSSPARLEELEGLCECMQRAEDDPALLNDLDTRWHRALIAGCRNERLHRYIEELRDTLRRYELAHLHQSGDFQASIDEHRAIADAERVGDRLLALNLLTEHWQRGLDELLARLPESHDVE